MHSNRIGNSQIIARNRKGFFDRAKPYIYLDSFCANIAREANLNDKGGEGGGGEGCVCVCVCSVCWWGECRTLYGVTI